MLPLIDNVTVYAINQNLSVSFRQSIVKMGWLLQDVGTIDKLCLLDIAVDSVLLIDEDTLLAHKGNQGFISQLAKFTLLGLCQVTLKPLSNDTCVYLDRLLISYSLVDMPLFRYTLDQISQALLFEKNREVLNRPVTKVKMADSSKFQKDKATNIDDKAALKPLSSHNAYDLQGVSVLLVEDNLVNQLVAKELLLNMNCKVIIADNGQRAIDTLSEHTFDVVLMDIQMPIMDGLSATKYIRSQENYQSLPIIAMTAHAREEDKQLSLAAGMNLHMPKPVTGKVLYDSIKQVLGGG